MPFIKVYIHFVWATKKRQKLMTNEIRTQIFNHIIENAKLKNIFVDCIGGYLDHIHCLISFDSMLNISNIMNLLKGESSYWINKNNLTSSKFEWQDEYFAVSVSESMIDKVRAYIKNQEEHHKHKTFKEEYDEIISKYGFQKYNDSK